MGNYNIINPAVNIVVEEGFTLTIGDYNIFEDKCYIKIRANKSLPLNQQPRDFYIGSYNVFEIDSKIYSPQIGDNNQFQPKSVIEQDVRVGNNCNIGACVKIPSSTILPNNTRIIYPNIQIKEKDFSEENHQTNLKELYTAQAELLNAQNQTNI